MTVHMGLLLAALTLAVAGNDASADSLLDFTVVGDVVSAPPGASALVSVVIMNRGAHITYINGITTGVTSEYALDDVFQPFEDYVPEVLGPGESWEGPVLRLSLSQTLDPGIETFDVSLSGGGHPYAADLIAFTYFAVDHSQVSAAGPGPGLPLPTLGAVPNPFQDNLTIDVTVVATTRVDVSVFDISGRHIVRLHSGDLPRGPHHWRWDGRDSDGSIPASGVYFIRLTTVERVLKTKVVRLN